MTAPAARAEEPAIYVGLMSGTSLDGISAAVVSFRDAADGRPAVELLGFTQRAYTSAERTRLAGALGKLGARQKPLGLGVLEADRNTVDRRVGIEGEPSRARFRDRYLADQEFRAAAHPQPDDVARGAEIRARYDAVVAAAYPAVGH